MPYLEYRCTQCGKKFEELVTRSDEPVACPHCGAKQAQRVYQGKCAFGAKGGGSGCSGSCSSCSGCGH